MAKRIDYIDICLRVERQDDGSYVNLLTNIKPTASDPDATKLVDRGPFMYFPVPAVYSGTTTLDTWLGEVLTVTQIQL